jgi:O-antigen/teichoic acid export membrane protein
MSLRQKTFSAVRWTTFDALGKALLTIASLSVLARILAPEDYGLMAIVTVILGFAGLFADIGINAAFVQRKDVTDEQRASLFWLNVFVSIVLALIVVGLSPIIAELYGEPRLAILISVSASVFILRALGQQVRMAAEKELKFRAVVTLELAAAFIGFFVAVLAALAGWGVLALVLSGVTAAAFSTLFFWLFISAGWRPALYLRVSDIRSLLRFGGALTADAIVNYINRTVDVFLGGKLLDAAALGTYSVPRTIALQLGRMINAVITRVGFPLIAKVQDDVDLVRSIYLQTLRMTAATNAPLYIGLAFFAQDLVHVILGPGWERSGALLQILALWGGIRSTGNPVGSLLFGMGRADLSLKWNLGLLLILPPTIWYGAKFGPEGMAWALLIAQLTLFFPMWFLLVRPVCRAKLFEYSSAALSPFLFSLVAIAPGFLIASQFDGALLRLLVGAAISGLLYLLISYYVNRAWVSAMLELLGRPEIMSNDRPPDPTQR